MPNIAKCPFCSGKLKPIKRFKIKILNDTY